MRFVKYCIPFLFTICTVSQLFWNWVCKIAIGSFRHNSLNSITIEKYYNNNISYNI